MTTDGSDHETAGAAGSFALGYFRVLLLAAAIGLALYGMEVLFSAV